MKSLIIHLLLLTLMLYSGHGMANVKREELCKSSSSDIVKWAGVVGITDYPAGYELDNPERDARLVGDALCELDYTVFLLLNPNIQAMNNYLDHMEKEAARADIAIMYFSGHGLYYEGENYLLSTTSIPERRFLERGFETHHLEDKMTKVKGLLSRLDNARQNSFLFLDACRYEPRISNVLYNNKGEGQTGLGRPVIPNEPNSSNRPQVLMATQPFKTAWDGPKGETSLFASALYKYLRQTDLDHRDVFYAVTEEVDKQSRDWGKKAGIAHQVPERIGRTLPESVCLDGSNLCKQQGNIDPQLADLKAQIERERQLRLEAEQRVIKSPEPSKLPFEPEMVTIPAGSFTMGCSSDEKRCSSNEFPAHKVTIAKPFLVGKYEITWDEYQPCIDEKACPDNQKDGGDSGWGKGSRPVIKVSWKDITEHYIPWLNGKTGKNYRLPTEAEWEYAARAGSRNRYHFGDSEQQLCRYANGPALETDYRWKNTTCRDDYTRTAPVGSFEPNNSGLYDMHGNVWEWTQDCWNSNYNGAPTNGSAWLEGNCSPRVVRGGSWFYVAENLRSAFRDRYDADARLFFLGFRLARTLD